MYTFSIYFVILLTLILEISSQSIYVQTPFGSIRGTTLKSRRGHDYYAFRGVPYAQAPTNNLRWKPPVPIKPWYGEFDATSDGPACFSPQRSGLPVEPMSEDCLRLNIYTPALPVNVSVAYDLRPVLVHIHGGGFVFLSGTMRSYDPIYFMESDIVVVTFNYRLNVLGFLSADNDVVPGNVGMLDQILLLKWIQSNIHYFGGDKSQVTLSGHSAGAMAVVAHLASPLSQGFFHRAIAMSGSFTFHWDIPHHRLKIVEKLGQHFKCNTTNTSEIIECLRKIPVDEISEGFNIIPDFLIFPLVIFYPIIENDHGQSRFLTQSPIKTFLQNNFHKVPILTGMTEVEFARLGQMILSDENVRSEFENNFERVAPIALQYEKDTPRSKHISSVLEKKFVTKPLRNDVETLRQFQYVSYK